MSGTKPIKKVEEATMAESARMNYTLAASTLDAARDAGITNELWDRFRSDADFRKRVVKAMETGACAPPRSGPLPMYFGPLEWETFFNVKLTAEQWAAAENVPWAADLADQPCPLWERAKIGKTHFAFFGIEGITREMSPVMMPAPLDLLPMNVAGIIKLTEDMRYARWQNRPRIVNDLERQGEIPTDTLEMRWYCIPMNRPVPSAMEGHVEVTPEGYEVATMVEYLAAKVFYYLLHTGHYQRYGDREYAPYAICGAPARQQREAKGPGYDLIYNQMVSQGKQDGIAVSYTTLNSGGHEWFTALTRKTELATA